MFEHEQIEKYCFNEIPIGEECYFMSEKYMEEFSAALARMLATDNHPYGVGYVSHAVARKINEHSIEFSWYPNIHTRFHEVSIILPKAVFKLCVGCSLHDVKPYIFIDHDWLENLFIREYSVFCLVDAIDVKTAIKDNLLTKEKLILLRQRIDELSSIHTDVSFISFADSLLLKSNWSTGYSKRGIKCTYEPESFIRIIKEIKTIYKDILNLNIYAILTQGSNEYYEEPLLHISESRNHICLNSLGAPFAELLAIEKAAKTAIKLKLHLPAEIYMDEQYYHSLNFVVGFEKNTQSRNAYKAIMKPGDSFYFFTSCADLLKNLANKSQ